MARFRHPQLNRCGLIEALGKQNMTHRLAEHPQLNRCGLIEAMPYMQSGERALGRIRS